MAVIEPCAYSADGKLMKPSPLATLRAKSRMVTPGTKYMPSLDIGYTHFFRITAFGRTAGEARLNSKARIGTLYGRLRQVEGFREIEALKYTDFIHTNRNYAVVFEITYAVERTGTRGQRYDEELGTPYPEYRQDLGKLGFGPETADVLKRR